jgi:hypothetical protein
MSVGKMSDAVVNHILTGLRNKIREDIRLKFLEEGSLKELKSGSILSNEIRTQTNKIQEGIMTQRSLELLAQDFQTAAESKEKDLIKLTADKYKGGKGKKDYPAVVAYITNKGNIRSLATQAADYLKQQSTFKAFVDWYTDKYLKTSVGVTGRVFKDNTIEQEFLEGKLINSFGSGKVDTLALIAKNLTHGDFNKRFIEFVEKKQGETLAQFIDANTDAGHFLGIFNLKFASVFDLEVIQTGGNISGISGQLKSSSSFTGSATEKQELDMYADKLTKSMQLMANADLISSNLLNNVELASTTTKLIYAAGGIQSSTEISLSAINQEAGRKLVATARQLKNLVKTAYAGGKDNIPNKNDFRNKLVDVFKAVSELSVYIETIGSKVLEVGNDAEKDLAKEIKDNSKDIANILRNTEGSDSFNTSISKSLIAAFLGKPLPKKQKTTSKDRLPVFPKAKPKNLTVPKLKVASAVKQATESVKVRIPKLNFTTNLTSNLTGLQTLIDAQLVERIKQNMGSGNRKDILNLRTGRFAESVKVQRLSESRAGMITAFYTYMRNPYGTFSEGGKQESPRSRDPKLLISKSIREIAQAKVQNRLRAVLI